MRQTRAAPAASIHKTRYVTPPQPEKRCKLAGRTYGMPFVSLILIITGTNPYSWKAWWILPDSKEPATAPPTGSVSAKLPDVAEWIVI